jgi:hypothetical protein
MQVQTALIQKGKTSSSEGVKSFLVLVFFPRSYLENLNQTTVHECTIHVYGTTVFLLHYCPICVTLTGTYCIQELFFISSLPVTSLFTSDGFVAQFLAVSLSDIVL